MSCRVPKGHAVEQYTLPNKRVTTITAKNPMDAKAKREKNLTAEGTNWRKRIYEEKRVTNFESGSELRNSNAVRIRKRTETKTLIIFRSESLNPRFL